MAGEATGKDKARAEREARLAQALRENLKRRKAQARRRDEDAAPETPTDPAAGRE